MNLDQAIGEQITRLSESVKPEEPKPDTEMQNLLQAFVSLINAYLQRLGGPPSQPKVSDTFGSLG